MALIVTLFFAAALFAVDVDYSGTWKFDKDKSEIPEFGGRPGGPGGRGGMTPPDMVITQKKNVVIVERTMIGRNGEERTTETKYNLTGKVTKEERRRGTTEHKANMKESVLHIESVRIFERDGAEMEMVTKSTWTLVDDGKGLLIESVSETPMGERKMKTYYSKQ
jgi:hypothetical protein